MKTKPLWIGIGTLVAVGALVGMTLNGRRAKPLEVQTGKVDRQKIVQTVSATGKIQPETQVEISADVSGKIIQLPVVEGQWVEKGAFLVGLDRERYVAAVERAEANVSSAQASGALVRENMNQTEKEFRRSKDLQERGLESPAAFEAKAAAHQVEVARYKAAMDQFEEAKGALKAARDDLSKTTIHAPMAGTISALNKERPEIALGSQFQKDVILVIADLTEMEARVKVDENDITSIAVGQPATIEVDAMLGQHLQGQVAEISSSANATGTGTAEQKTEFEVEIRITDPPPTLRPGMTATASIIAKTNENALSVPIQSVAVRSVDQLAMKGEKRSDAEARYKADKDGFVEIVFAVDKGKAIAKQVKTGIQSDERIEILEGLAEGGENVTGSYRAISKDLENGATVTTPRQPAAPERGKPRGS
jgi:HlyD family secretion protein